MDSIKTLLDDEEILNNLENGGYEITSDFIEARSAATVAYIIMTEVINNDSK